MAIRNQQKLSITNLLIEDTTGANPVGAEVVEGRLENAYLGQRGQLVRATFAPAFHSSAASSEVWAIRQFDFVRDSAPESRVLIFKANGKVYKRRGGEESEVFPASTGLAALVNKPAIAMIADRLHVSDGSQYLIYDGWDWFVGGLTAPASAPTTAFVAGSLTGTYKVAISAVHIRNAVRIHESSRSPITAVLAPSSQNIRVTKPSDLPARATHWSVYMSEVSGSEELRRATTVAITASTTDISAEPAATSPLAPVRNDPIQPTRVLTQWKNRLAMRNEQQPDNFWFTAFQEVKALLNGAPEESLPGRDASSISDLTNEWTLPDRGEELRGAVWHEDFLFLFTDRGGYVIRGEGGLLDNQGLRDIFPVRQFTEGVAGPFASVSTPNGLVRMTLGKRIMLWPGGEQVIDIGEPIQSDLDAIKSANLFDVELFYTEVNGRNWLCVVGMNDNSLRIFDFAHRPQGSNAFGTWLRNTQANVSSVGEVNFGAATFLLAGTTTGDVVALDKVMQPAHLGHTAILNECYFGATVQNSPAATIRTASFAPQGDIPTEGKYLTLTHRTDDGGTSGTNPTVTVHYDQINPDSPTGGISLTLGSRLSWNEQRAWLKFSASSSAAGALAKRFQIEATWPAGVDTETATDPLGTRPKLINNELLQFSFSWQPRAELTE